MLLVYQSSRNFSGAALAMRLIGDAHRGTRRLPLRAGVVSRTASPHCRRPSHDEGERQSVLLDEAITLKALGDTQYLMGRVEDALNSYAESLTLHARMPGDELHEADAHKANGDVLHFLGRYAEALPEYERALAAYRTGRRGDQRRRDAAGAGPAVSSAAAAGRGASMLRRGPGHLSALWQFHRHGQCPAGHWQQRATARANRCSPMQHFEEALNIYRKQKNEAGEAAALKALGDASVKLQQFDRAAECYNEALTQFETAGLRRNVAETELAIGRLRRAAERLRGRGAAVSTGA